MTANMLSEHPEDSARGSAASRRGPDSEESLRAAFGGFRNLIRHLHRYEQLRTEQTPTGTIPPVQAHGPQGDPPAPTSTDDAKWDLALVPLRQSLDELTRVVQSLRDDLPQELAARTAEALSGSFDHLAARMDRLGQVVQTPPAPTPAAVHTPVLPPAPTPPISERMAPELLRTVFGEHVGNSPELRVERDRLLDGLMQQDPHAGCFVGYLLLFQFAAVGERPRLLRPLGEAFYRWCPKDEAAAAFETAVIGWVNRRCQQEGLPIRVEPVALNCRFDAERHHAAGQAGRDVTDVLGWVVRSQDKVFDRAMVGVR